MCTNMLSLKHFGVDLPLWGINESMFLCLSAADMLTCDSRKSTVIHNDVNNCDY